MADAFDFSSTRPRSLSNLLLVIGAAFLLLAAPMLVYGFSLPSTLENEMFPFIMLLCGGLIAFCGLGMLAIGVRIRMRYPNR